MCKMRSACGPQTYTFLMMWPINENVLVSRCPVPISFVKKFQRRSKWNDRKSTLILCNLCELINKYDSYTYWINVALDYRIFPKVFLHSIPNILWKVTWNIWFNSWLTQNIFHAILLYPFQTLTKVFVFCVKWRQCSGTCSMFLPFMMPQWVRASIVNIGPVLL